MIFILFALAPIAIVLVASELLWRRGVLRGERARKFIHVLAGSWVAFWPYYIPLDGIVVLSVAMLTLTIYSRATKLFHAIYAVKRKTYGDIIYALGLLLCAYLGTEPWVFTVSVLLLALADGGAAVVGRLYGKRSTYLVFGSKHLRKSVLGTLAFLVLAYLSVGIGWFTGGAEVLREHISVTFVILPLGATLLENVVPSGFDNLITPLFATLLLNSLI